jgi:hypothetical protein
MLRRLATPLSCAWRITGVTFSAKRRAASAERLRLGEADASER